MEEDEEIDIVGNYEHFISKTDQAISKISSGQILSCDYTVHPNWLNENAEGGNYWTDSVPKNENLESNVEILHSEEVVIEEPEPVPSITDLEWSGEIAPHDDLVFEDEIPASIEEVVTNQEEEVLLESHDSVTVRNDQYKWETAAFETHPPTENIKYIGPTNSRSLLKVKIEPTSQSQPVNPRSLLKNNLKISDRPPSKFKQTLTLNPNVLIVNPKTHLMQVAKTKPMRSGAIAANSSKLSTPKFKQTVKLMPRDLENAKFKMFTKKLKKARTAGGKKTGSKSKKMKKANNFYGENITISHEAEEGAVQGSVETGIVLKLSNCEADSDIDVDIESESDTPIENNAKYNQSDKLVKPLENKLRITDCPNKFTSDKSMERFENVYTVPLNRRYPNLSEALINELHSTAVPAEEFRIDPIEISDLEKFIHSEFFENRTSKTSEQYLRIRNHILDMWQTLKPNYVSKTAVRSGLKHGGDVNCISRIHRLLEQIGAINFGCEGKYFEYVRPLETFISMFVQIPRSRTNSNGSSVAQQNKFERRQRIRTNTLTCSTTDIADADSNYTVAHMAGVIRPDPPALNTNYKLRQNVRHIKTELDLVKCLKFSKENIAPFKVSITLSTLLCIQLHSQSSSFEVMGFLGGHRSKSVGRNKISLTRYKPCKTSTQSGIMCEMCPVSQVEQSASLGDEGHELLGWFHSHPLFPANPSRTDVRTQQEMQLQFSFDNDRPFVGLIFSCLDMTFKCVYMMPKSSPSEFDDNDLPYEIDVDIIKDCTNFKMDVKDVLYIVQENNVDTGELIEKFKTSSETILKQFGFKSEAFFADIF